jgi:hypothetical protein
MIRNVLVLTTLLGFSGAAHAGATSAKLTAIKTAATVLKKVVAKTPQAPRTKFTWGGVDRGALVGAIKVAKLSPAGRRALLTAYAAAFPSGTEGRIDPQRADIKAEIDRGVARLAKVANAQGVVTAAKAKTTAGWNPKNIFAFAVSRAK